MERAQTERSYTKGLLRYIVPFYVDGEGERFIPSYASLCRRVDEKRAVIRSGGAAEALWQPYADADYGTAPDLYEHIAASLRCQGGLHPGAIAQTWRYRPFELGGNKRRGLLWVRRDGTVQRLHVAHLGVTLFTSGVGFLWYELGEGRGEALHDSDIGDLLEFSNQFKELSRAPGRRLLDGDLPAAPADGEDPAAKPDPEVLAARAVAADKRCAHLDEAARTRLQAQLARVFAERGVVWLPAQGREPPRWAARLDDFGRWLRDLLCDTLGPVRFFLEAQKNGLHMPDKALVFAYADTECADMSALRRCACLLGKGYDEKYQVFDATPEKTLQLFGNACCYISREGCAYVAGKQAGAFFDQPFADRFRTIYFWVYMLLLQQAYGLLNYARLMAVALPADAQAYREDEADAVYARRMDRLLLEMNTFLVTNQFASVSGIHHINDFYLYGSRRLAIEAETESLYNGLRALGDMQRERVRLTREREERERQAREERAQRQRDEQEAAADRKVERGLSILSIVALVSALCDTLGLFTGFHDVVFASNESGPSAWGVLFVLCAVLAWTVFFALTFRRLWPVIKALFGRDGEPARNENDVRKGE